MINEELADYVKAEKSKGTSDDVIRARLDGTGWTEKQIDDALSFIKLEESADKAIQQKKISSSFGKIGIVIAIIAILAIIGYSIFSSSNDAVCGDGIIDESENVDNCCLDTGCPALFQCEANKCIETNCGECQYREDDICKDYKCCLDSDCKKDEICTDNKCEQLDCGECGYSLNNQCETYTCCSDDDCSGKVCANPSSLDSVCADSKNITFSENEITLSESLSGSFEYENEVHKIHIKTITTTSVTFTIQSEIQEVTLTLWQSRAVDLDNDNLGDVVITLTKIGIDDANIILKEVVCKEDSECDDEISNTLDKCSHPGTESSVCTFIVENECINDSDCDDELPWTRDLCYGTEFKECINYKVTECEHNDGYCPIGCYNTTDRDCEYGYECDYDYQCDDDKASTTNECEPDRKYCIYEDITTCNDDDGYCPSGCSAEDDDNDC